jgi:hypothetical protein
LTTAQSNEWPTNIRTISGREPGEDILSAWFFESGAFCLKSSSMGMQLKNDFARCIFGRKNSDLLGVHYWQEVQQKLRRGEVPATEHVP